MGPEDHQYAETERPARFYLYRREDESGVSGVGMVAYGVVFPDGSCALRWRTEHRSTAVYDDLATLRAIHGHNGKTTIVWFDDPPDSDGGSNDA